MEWILSCGPCAKRNSEKLRGLSCLLYSKFTYSFRHCTSSKMSPHSETLGWLEINLNANHSNATKERIGNEIYHPIVILRMYGQFSSLGPQ
jgi:hypothetical protein